MSLIVKICGLSTRETLDVALDAGADMVGFVFFPPSPRHIDDLSEMGRLVDMARGRAETVVLTVDAEDEMLDRIVRQVRPGWLQLHGTESADAVTAAKEAFGVQVMKALPIAVRGDLERIPRYAAVADRILFDAHPPKEATRPGGLGAVFDWHILENLDLALPFMVSGGLHTGNVAEALRVTRAGGVDVSSGVERAPGIKDPEMIRAFIRAARATDLTSPLPVYGERWDSQRDPGGGVASPSSLAADLRQEPLTPTPSERASLVSTPQARGEGAETVRRR
jgi:phosphoribosylanthranilate isomerase